VEADGTVPRVSGRQRGLRLSVAAVTLALLVAAARAHAFTCEATDGTGCPVPGSTCFAGCDEADLRSAIALLNGCLGAGTASAQHERA